MFVIVVKMVVKMVHHCFHHHLTLGLVGLVGLVSLVGLDLDFLGHDLLCLDFLWSWLS